MSEGPTRWKERHLGREAALQLLYQSDIGGLKSTDVEEAIEKAMRGAQKMLAAAQQRG